MRPLELRLRNFRSFFGDDTVIDFRGRRLVGIVGPIGAGKSSILDAIAFALFGRTATIATSTKSLIHQRADGATVVLRFEVDGQVWEVVRALRTKGQSKHQLTRLVADTDDAAQLERVTLEADINARIAELLGLEFDAFSRSVMLAQGQFAEFLRSRPAERDAVLKGVFGHDRIDAMRATAKERVQDLTSELDKLAARLEHVDRLTARIAERRSELAAAEDGFEAMRKAEPKHTDLTERIRTGGERIDQLESRTAELAKLSKRLPDEAVATSLLAEATDVEATRTELAEELEQAQEALRGAETTLADPETAEMSGRLERAVALVAAREPLVTRVADDAARLERLESAIAEAGNTRQAFEAALQTASTAAERAKADAATAIAGQDSAEHALHRARYEDMAATLRGSLVEGELCPVCAQEVQEVPQSGDGRAVDELEDALAKARSAREAADAGATLAVGELEGAKSALEGLVARAESMAAERQASLEAAQASRKDLAATNAELTELVGAAETEVLIAGIRDELAHRKETANQAKRTLERVRERHDDAIRHQQSLARGLDDLRITLVDLAARLGTDREIGDDPASIERVLATSRQTLVDEQAAGAVENDALRADVAAATTDLRELLDELAIATDFSTAITKFETRIELLRIEIERDEGEIAKTAGLADERERLDDSRALFTRLVSDLTDSKFVRYLLDDERTRLADLGSDHFQQLSSGRYRFSNDGSFNVVDLTAADAVRKADSLSGGETFLASLGLALALAEMVSRTGGRLDAFFLDEGFGSLDPEHLDLAMEGIELLAAGSESRLVVVVSHVPEMRHRLEDLIELDKSPVTGDTRVVRA